MTHQNPGRAGLRLLVDARYVRPVHDGISRYSASILHSLARCIESGEYPGLAVAMLVSDDAQLDQLPPLPSVRGYSPTGPWNRSARSPSTGSGPTSSSLRCRRWGRGAESTS
jgi:hypothetical protein